VFWDCLSPEFALSLFRLRLSHPLEKEQYDLTTTDFRMTTAPWADFHDEQAKLMLGGRGKTAPC